MKKLGIVWSEYSFIFVLIVIFIVYAITSSGLTWSGVMNIFRHSAVIGTVALGMGLICLTGEIDLSVGSMLALTAGFSVMVFNVTGSILLTLLFALGFGALCGFVNGLLVGGVQMPAFIVTLATMLIYRSISQYMMNEMGQTRYSIDATLSKYRALFNFGNGDHCFGLFIFLGGD